MIRPEILSRLWPKKPLGDAVEFLDHFRRPITARDRKSGPYPYYGANGQQDSVADYLFDEPLILLAEDGGYFGDPERTIAYQVEGKCWVNNHAHVLRPKQDVDIDFLCRQLEHYDVTPFINGATRPKLTKSSASEIPIILPPLAEQKRIAAILGKADAIRSKRQAGIILAEDLLRATFLDMFGNPVINPKGWKLGTLNDLVLSVKDGPHVSPEYSTTGIPFLSTRHLRPGKIIWEDLKYITRGEAEKQWKKCKPERGDILYTKGGTTGIAVAFNSDKEIAVWVHVAVLKTNHEKTDPIWLESMLNTSYCYAQSQRYTHGITNQDLGLTRMVNIKIYLPPLEQQQKFAKIVTKIKKMSEWSTKQQAVSDSLFNALTQRAFRGEL